MHLAVKLLKEFQNSLSSKLLGEGLEESGDLHKTGHGLPYYHHSKGNASWDLCLDLIQEEYDEFLDTVYEVESILQVSPTDETTSTQTEQDARAAQLLKEMCDLLYVIIGMSVRYKELSFLPEAFNMVHANNMLKLNEGTISKSGKLQKPPNYSPVDLTELVVRGREL
jgi:hypothetical protein|tara:strand:+ start:5134 stop:5637 length:504 start_codon:yes stop_codon:yes gene_type:complete